MAKIGKGVITETTTTTREVSLFDVGEELYQEIIEAMVDSCGIIISEGKLWIYHEWNDKYIKSFLISDLVDKKLNTEPKELQLLKQDLEKSLIILNKILGGE